MKYKEVKVDKELEDFLRKEGLLKKFKKNVVKYWTGSADSIHTSISSSFEWKRTEEGPIFWLNLDHQRDEERKEKNAKQGR